MAATKSGGNRQLGNKNHRSNRVRLHVETRFKPKPKAFVGSALFFTTLRSLKIPLSKKLGLQWVSKSLRQKPKLKGAVQFL